MDEASFSNELLIQIHSHSQSRRRQYYTGQHNCPTVVTINTNRTQKQLINNNGILIQISIAGGANTAWNRKWNQPNKRRQLSVSFCRQLFLAFTTVLYGLKFNRNEENKINLTLVWLYQRMFSSLEVFCVPFCKDTQKNAQKHRYSRKISHVRRHVVCWCEITIPQALPGDTSGPRTFWIHDGAGVPGFFF